MVIGAGDAGSFSSSGGEVMVVHPRITERPRLCARGGGAPMTLHGAVLVDDAPARGCVAG